MLLIELPSTRTHTVSRQCTGTVWQGSAGLQCKEPVAMEDEYRWASGVHLVEHWLIYWLDYSEDREQGWAKVLRAPAALQQSQSNGEGTTFPSCPSHTPTPHTHVHTPYTHSHPHLPTHTLTHPPTHSHKHTHPLTALPVPPARQDDWGTTSDSLPLLLQHDAGHHDEREKLRLTAQLHSCRL